MRKRFLRVFFGFAVLGSWPELGTAQDRIQSFVNGDGKIVFTNGVDNLPLEVVPTVARTWPLSASGTAIAVQGGRRAARTAEDAIPEGIRSLISSVSKTHGVDPKLVAAMMKVESNYNPSALSSKGAMGLMQLIPATGRRFGVQDFFDPRQNIEGGVRYLKFLLTKFSGNVDLSLAAYNAGENLVERLGRIPAIPETRDYVRKIRLMYTGNSAVIASVIAEEAIFEKPETVLPAQAEMFTSVDERGVVRFSNIGPPN